MRDHFNLILIFEKILREIWIRYRKMKWFRQIKSKLKKNRKGFRGKSLESIFIDISRILEEILGRIKDFFKTCWEDFKRNSYTMLVREKLEDIIFFDSFLNHLVISLWFIICERKRIILKHSSSLCKRRFPVFFLISWKESLKAFYIES